MVVDMNSILLTRNITYMSILVALNVGLGKVANILGLPFAMDTIGTIIGGTILPLPAVIIVGILSSVGAAIVTNPVFLFFAGTQVAIGIVAFFLARARLFERPVSAAFGGFVVGVLSAIVSAPVIAIVFGGVATPTITAINAVFLAAGQGLWQSVLQGALIVESIDKVFAGIVAWLIIKRLPRTRNQ